VASSPPRALGGGLPTRRQAEAWPQ
jgi:hypothetical protein